jgi:hypothetical protein
MSDKEISLATAMIALGVILFLGWLFVIVHFVMKFW